MHRWLIPVIDVRHGIAVHAVRGERSSYRPLADSFDVPSGLPNLTRRLAEHFQRIYVADLDGLIDGTPNRELPPLLNQLPCETIFDAGWPSPKHLAESLPPSCRDRSRIQPVMALETLRSAEDLAEFPDNLPGHNLFFSLDLRNGIPCRPPNDSTPNRHPLEWVRLALDAGLENLIVLDVASVGTRQGIPTLELVRRIRSRHPKLHIFTGGGVRSEADVAAAIESGCRGVLVGTALYSGALRSGFGGE